MAISQIMPKVLVADDDLAQRLVLRKTLEEEGYYVTEAENGDQALQALYDEPDLRLLLTDLAMPVMDGYKLIQAVREDGMRYIYIVVLTSFEDRESLLRALSLGADDYLIKPVFPDELKLRLKGGGRLLRLESNEELVFSMAKLAEFRSDETGFHLERVRHYTRILALDLARNHPAMKLTPIVGEELSRVSPLHDIGKVAIPDHILHKPGKLTAEEFEVMKGHTTIGGKLIKEIYDRTGSPYLWLGYEIAMFHHERWDGRGYPEGLSGEDIPLAGRIMALADVYDALTSRRCYKDAFSHQKAKDIILAGEGSHFDPRIVAAFLRQEEQWLEIKRTLAD